MSQKSEIIPAVIAMRGLTEAVVKKYVAENMLFTSRSMALALAKRFADTHEEILFLRRSGDDLQHQTSLHD